MTDPGITAATAVPTALDADYESTRFFKAPADAVFDALTTPSGLAGWWTAVSGSGLKDGELTFVFGDEPVIMRVDEAVRPSIVRWSVLSCDLMEDWVGTTITFDVSPTETGGSRLDFRHIGLTPRLECFTTCKKGWEQYLPSLVDYVDTGQGHPVGSTTAG